MKKYKLLLVTSVLTLTACSKIDDYMLGKDNTPSPTPLKPVAQKVKMQVEWSRPVGNKGGNRYALKLNPVLADGAIYTADYNGTVSAVDKKSGVVQWQNKTGHKIVSGPAVGAHKIAITTADAQLILIDRTSGKTNWVQALSNEALSPPVIAQQRVLVKSINGKLYAFNTKTAKQDWVYEHGSPNLILRSGSAPVVKGNLVMVGFSDGKLDGVDLNKGQLLWQRSVSYPRGSSDVERLVDIDSKPIIDGATAYAASYQGYISALSLTSGQFLWRYPLSTYKDMTLKFDNLFATDSDDVVWAINRRSGKAMWHQDGLKARHLSAPGNLGKQVIVGDQFGYLHLLAVNDGHLDSRLLLPFGGISATPVVSGNNVYVFTDDGVLVKVAVG